MFSEHLTHGKWTKDGRCIFCACGERLYQGELPTSNEEKTVLAAALDGMVAAVKVLMGKK